MSMSVVSVGVAGVSSGLTLSVTVGVMSGVSSAVGHRWAEVIDYLGSMLEAVVSSLPSSGASVTIELSTVVVSVAAAIVAS